MRLLQYQLEEDGFANRAGDLISQGKKMREVKKLVPACGIG